MPTSVWWQQNKDGLSPEQKLGGLNSARLSRQTVELPEKVKS